MTAVRQVVAGLSGIALAGGIALGASIALATSAHATCNDIPGGSFGGGVCTVVTAPSSTKVPVPGPSGRTTNNPWTETTTTTGGTTTYHGNGPGAFIGSQGGTTTVTIANPGGHEVSGVPGGGAP
jgi:hypothetical protein